MNIEELKRLAEAATPGPWKYDYDDQDHDRLSGILWGTNLYAIATIPYNGQVRDEKVTATGNYIAAANPAAVLELIAEVEALRANATGLEHQLRESRQNDYHAMSYLADCRFAVGDDGKRMLPEFVEYLKALKQQRDELLASLKEARELVEDWGAYAPAYMQEKHDLQGDLDKLDASIANANTNTEKQS